MGPNEIVDRYWGSLCEDLESAVAAFDKNYALSQGISVDVNRKDDCLHVDLSPREPSEGATHRARSLGICLDRTGSRIVVRLVQVVSELRVRPDAQGKAQVVDECSTTTLTNDQVSELILGPFFFP